MISQVKYAVLDVFVLSLEDIKTHDHAYTRHAFYLIVAICNYLELRKKMVAMLLGVEPQQVYQRGGKFNPDKYPELTKKVNTKLGINHDKFLKYTKNGFKIKNTKATAGAYTC